MDIKWGIKKIIRLKLRWRVILIGFLISCNVILSTAPLHETAHWIISDLDPYIEPIEIHFFKSSSTKANKNFLFSTLGYVVIEEKYPGASKDRPVWAYLFQEVTCHLIQFILAVWISLKSIILICIRYPDFSYTTIPY